MVNTSPVEPVWNRSAVMRLTVVPSGEVSENTISLKYGVPPALHPCWVAAPPSHLAKLMVMLTSWIVPAPSVTSRVPDEASNTP